MREELEFTGAEGTGPWTLLGAQLLLLEFACHLGNLMGGGGGGEEQAEGAAWPPPSPLADISPTCLSRPYHSGRSCFLF